MDKSEYQMVPSHIIKVVQALGFLLNLDDNHKMDRVKLIKLLWAADRFHIRKYGRTVSKTKYVAMIHGPVSSIALDAARITRDFALDDASITYVENHFTATNEQTAMSLNPGTDHLSQTDQEALEWSWKTFGNTDTFDLADNVSHAYPEWMQYKKFFDVQKSGQQPIKDDSFFDNPGGDATDPFAIDPKVLTAAKETYNQTASATSELKAILGL